MIHPTGVYSSIKIGLMATCISLSCVAQVHAQQWTLTKQSAVGFDIKSRGLMIVQGRFNQVQSNLRFDRQAPQNSSAQFVLDIKSLSLSRPVLKQLILSEDLFYADKYETASFNSDQFIPLGHDQYSIKGALTLRGVTKSVTLNTVLKPNLLNPDLLDVESKATVKGSDFGMKQLFGGIGNNVNIHLSGQWQAL